MFQVVADYPGSAAFGGCYLTRSSKGVITEIDPASGDPVNRPERVITTSLHSDYEGDICLGEKTIRHLAHLLGMVDDWRVRRLQHVYEETVLELTRMSDLNVRLIGENVALRDRVDHKAIERLYVATDGSLHASAKAAEEKSRQVARLPRSGLESLQPISAAEAPLDVPEMA